MTSSNRFTYAYENEASTHELLDQSILNTIDKFHVRSILDLGCGNGNLSIKLSNIGYDVTGCDPEESAINIANSIKSNAVFKLLGVYDEPTALGSSKFDLVLASEVVEHLFLPRKLPSFAYNVLKPNGFLVLTTPYYGNYFKNFISSVLNKWDDHFTALWDGGHIKFWSLKTLTKLLNEGGFEVVDCHTINRQLNILRFLWPNNIIIVAKKRS